MPKQRVLSDGSKFIITDEKITRRLDAITDYGMNHVISGLDITPVATFNAVAIAAGVVVMNNMRRTVSAVASVAVGTYPNTKFATIYIPSIAGNVAYPTVAIVASTSTAWCPDQTMQGTATNTVVPKESMLVSHIYRGLGISAPIGTSILVASGINDNVRPRLYFDTAAWQKDDNTDIDTSITYP